ncbi:hypothetical protein [Singulisphaera acidiphila]|uniref:Uncharacterized protein n=1 Tax=Singulisphaera acidiphila (strain ATCC BAA-1392 / DSM 18658 / VKM B-2454 / MOB10) TaxID=886293 RepID=L0DQY1_SINAD|nr:hypothetical protein [Singulisphaera acidiphila]AGA31405.1 hypothetical protein Sinac_7366 [Singulisphaera acidiphila DSM 18658]
MDTELLVEQQQKDDGKRLVEQLDHDGFPVTVAFWALTSEEGPWNLYVASSSFDEAHPSEAYRSLFSAVKKIHSSWISPSDVKLLDDQDPTAQDAVEVRDRHPSPLITNFQGKRLGDLPIEKAVIYPEIASPRQSFTVTYSRDGESNDWTATVKRGPIYRMQAKGAISYSAASWTGATAADQKFANVSVLIEIDPRFAHPDLLALPDMKKLTANQARKLADEMFKQYHPDAVIEHDEDEEDGDY